MEETTQFCGKCRMFLGSEEVQFSGLDCRHHGVCLSCKLRGLQFKLKCNICYNWFDS